MRIRYIDDVLPAVRGRKEFAVKTHPVGYTTIDYNYVLPDSFDCPIRRECRGIKFGADGKVLARPLHKFFNVGEREETFPDAIDFSRPHVVVEKMDGSMIHPVIMKNRLRLSTRAGITEVAEQCENRHLNLDLIDFCAEYLNAGMTPVFEWVSPDNRIVIDATNLRRKSRMEMADLAPTGTRVCYAVFNRPLDQKLQDFRGDVPESVIRKQDRMFRSQEKSILAGDGRNDVDVLDMRQKS